MHTYIHCYPPSITHWLTMPGTVLRLGIHWLSRRYGLWSWQSRHFGLCSVQSRRSESRGAGQRHLQRIAPGLRGSLRAAGHCSRTQGAQAGQVLITNPFFPAWNKAPRASSARNPLFQISLECSLLYLVKGGILPLQPE